MLNEDKPETGEQVMPLDDLAPAILAVAVKAILECDGEMADKVKPNYQKINALANLSRAAQSLYETILDSAAAADDEANESEGD